MKSYAVRIVGALAASAIVVGVLFLYLGRFTTFPRASDLASGMLDFVESYKAKPQVTEAELLDYARTPVNLDDYSGSERSLGYLNGVEVILAYPCSDLCPGYAVRVIRLEVPIARTCSQAGGVERSVNVAGVPWRYCFPQILIDNWDAYRRFPRER